MAHQILCGRGTVAQLVVRPHTRRTGWLYAFAARPRARRLLRVLGLVYVPPTDEPIVPGTLTDDARAHPVRPAVRPGGNVLAGQC